MRGIASAFCHFDVITKQRLRSAGRSMLPSSSLFVDSNNLVLSQSTMVASPTVDAVVSTGVYEPIMPSTETVLGMTLIVVLCALTAWIWQSQVVPTARTNLAISKSRGPLKEYLDELKASDPRASVDDWVEIGASGDTSERQEQANPTFKDGRALERWLFDDWLKDNKSARRLGGRQKDPALPLLRNAKWNSGDNPVLVATLLIGIGVILTAVSERVVSLT